MASHGGARPGAGRKKNEVTNPDIKKNRAVKYSDREWVSVKNMAKKNNMKVSEYIRFRTLQSL